jgi:agmatinase
LETVKLKISGIRTFARLPTVESVARTDVAILGAPFDGGTSFRPGARFAGIAQSSCRGGRR